MNLILSIASAEQSFRQNLEDFFISVYDEGSLPSHGIDHHRRVWEYAKEILLQQGLRLQTDPSILSPKLIVAAFLHDIGMSGEPGPRHGIFSRELCRQFLRNNNLDEEDYRDVLETIEIHDRKDYSNNTLTGDLLLILSAADDLDAFGYMGIYRYSEVYISRGIEPAEMGYLIMKNAVSRFQNLEKTLGTNNALVIRHKERFEILCDFFRNYNNQVASYNFNTDLPEGYCGLIQLFIQLLKNKISFNEFLNDAVRHDEDITIRTFMNGLRSELK